MFLAVMIRLALIGLKLYPWVIKYNLICTILPLNIFNVSVIHTVMSVSVGKFSGHIMGQGSTASV